MLSPMFMRRRARARYEAEMQAAFAANAWHAAGNDGDDETDGLIVDDEDGPMWVLPPKSDDTTETVTDVVTADEAPAAEAEPPRPQLTEREVLIDMASQLTRALERVTTMCDHVIQYVEVDRAERHAMLEAERAERRLTLEALGQLVRAAGGQPPTLPATSSPAAERLLGGSMPAGAEAGDDVVLDLTTVEHGPQVRCRFDDVWLDGFEVSEVVHDGEDVRYRLRRVADGAPLPELFASDDIRPVEHPDALPHLENIDDTPKNGSTSHWSPL
jgi:hypothetical protein